MRSWILGLAVAAMGMSAQAADLPGVGVTGDGRWEVNCHVIAAGEPKTILLGPDRAAYSNAGLSRAECKYRVNSGTGLKITVSAPEACPFTGSTPDACSIDVPASKAGSFKFRVAKAR